MNAALRFTETDRHTTQQTGGSCHSTAISTIGLRGTKLVPATTLVPVNDREAAERFASVVLPFSVGELAQAGFTTKEAAKAWKRGRNTPRWVTMCDLAHSIPEIHRHALSELDPHQAETRTSEIVTGFLAQLQQLAHAPGRDGAEARAVLAAMGRV